MPNQMIALQAKGPNLPDPANQTAKFVNMMNMTKQQEAAERQASLAQQQMDVTMAREKRDVQTQGAAMRKSDQDFQIANMTRLRNIGLAVLKSGNEEAYQDLVNMIGETDPEFGATIRKIAPTLASNPKALRYVIDEAKNYLDTNNSKRKTEIIYDKAGTPIVVDSGGDTEYEATPLVATKIRDVNQPPPSAPPPPAAAAAAEQQPPMSPSPIPNGQFGEIRVRPDNATPLTPDMQADIDRIKKSSGMVNTPASFTPSSMGTPTAGQMSPDMVPAILDSAVKTGVMAQIDLDQMLALAPPQARDGIMNVIRTNKISLQADAPSLAASAMGQQQPMAANPVQRPQSQFANMRGPAPQASFADLGGQPAMQNTMAQYKVGDPIQGRDPRMSPTPGIYNVSPQDVATTSRAGRPSKQEMYDAEFAKIKAQRDAGPAPVTAQQKLARKTELAKAYSKTQTLIDKAYNPKEGIISIANKIKSLSRDQKEAITGYSGYVPSFRESTREADTLFGNLKGVVTALGKDVAAASGAISSMAVQEWTIVADMIAKLDPTNMTPRALDAQMDRIIEQVSNATKLAEGVYDAQYGDDVKELPAFKLRGTPPARTKTPVAKGETSLSPDIDKILKSRGI